MAKRRAHHADFSWDSLGDIAEGRGSMGENMPVAVYRMLEYSMNTVLVQECGQETADELFREAGHLVGSEIAKRKLDMKVDLEGFATDLHDVFKEMGIGLVDITSYDEETGAIEVTVSEDLDCSGLPPTNEVVCHFDEGLIAGILDAYLHLCYSVREVDCWAKGDRYCRFEGRPLTIAD